MARREMQPIKVETREDGTVALIQSIHSPNDPDPVIELTCEQAPIVASWILDAAGDASQSIHVEDDRPIPVRYYARGPEVGPEELKVFCNDQGMVILKIDDETFLEIAPAMAKRLRERLSTAIRGSLTDLLRPDAEA